MMLSNPVLEAFTSKFIIYVSQDDFVGEGTVKGCRTNFIQIQPPIEFPLHQRKLVQAIYASYENNINLCHVVSEANIS